MIIKDNKDNLFFISKTTKAVRAMYVDDDDNDANCPDCNQPVDNCYCYDNNNGDFTDETSSNYDYYTYNDSWYLDSSSLDTTDYALYYQEQQEYYNDLDKSNIYDAIDVVTHETVKGYHDYKLLGDVKIDKNELMYDITKGYKIAYNNEIGIHVVSHAFDSSKYCCIQIPANQCKWAFDVLDGVDLPIITQGLRDLLYNCKGDNKFIYANRQAQTTLYNIVKGG